MKLIIINRLKINTRISKTATIFTGLITAITPLFAALPALAMSDTTAPTVTALSVQGTNTYTANEFGGLFEVLADFSDDISGFNGGTITYTSPSGNQTTYGTFSNNQPGYYSGVTINAYPEQGTWTPTLQIVDHSGNMRTYTNSQLQQMGYDVTFTVSGGTSDTTAPNVTALNVTSPRTFTASAGGGYVEVACSFSDNLSGFNGGALTYTSPSGNQSTYGTFAQGESGYVSGITMGAYAEQGTWTPSLSIIDRAGNTHNYTSSQLQQMGYDVTFTVSGGTSDTTKPTVRNLKFDVAHPAVEAPFGGAVVTLTADIADDLSGINETQFIYNSASGNQNTGVTNFVAAEDGKMRVDITVPPYAESGTWNPSLRVSDRAGNTLVMNASDLQAAGEPGQFSIFKTNSAHLSAGGSLTSDVEGDGATALDPVEATVTTPVEGDVSIVAIDSSAITDATNGYTFFGRQLSIVAPTASVEDPLSLTFRIDSSKIPEGQSVNDFQVVKNGSILPNCVDSTTANPDACVYSRQTLVDGDISVSVHSTTASVWTGGFPTPPPTPAYTFKGFSGTKDSPALNNLGGGAVAPMFFSLGGDKGLNILSDNSPTSKQINCTTKAAIGDSIITQSWHNRGLSYVANAKTYSYTWQTEKEWKGSCRQFDLNLKDGSTHSALFKFN
jgi:hypothetical protein